MIFVQFPVFHFGIALLTIRFMYLCMKAERLERERLIRTSTCFRYCSSKQSVPRNFGSFQVVAIVLQSFYLTAYTRDRWCLTCRFTVHFAQAPSIHNRHIQNSDQTSILLFEIT